MIKNDNSITRIVLRHELKILSRNRVLVLLFAIMLLMLISALWIGSSMLRKQHNTITKIRAHESEMADSLKVRIRHVEAANMFYPGFIWDDPTFAYNNARNEGPRFAVKIPYPLQMLSTGQADVQAYYYKVYINKKQYLTYETEIENSFLQFIGNFDFAFVVTFLLPLLIIIFTYNIYSVEKEQGTWVLLKTSNQTISRLLSLRITIRYLLFTGCFWLIVTPVLLCFIGPGFLFQSNWLWLVSFVSLYFAFWFACSFLLNSFSLSSNANAGILIFGWLLTSVLIPNALQIGLNKLYPIPSRILLTNEERKAINNYFEKQGQDLTRDVFNSPRTMIRQASIVTPGMVFGYGVIVYKSQEIKDAASAVAEHKLYDQIEKQQASIQRWQFVSPALMMQETLSALAGTHWHQFNEFSKDVDTFRKTTQQFYYPKMASENTYRTFTVKDADAIPVFKARQYAQFGWMNLWRGFIGYLVITIALLASGYYRYNHLRK